MAIMEKKAIGIFDSGIGGLTVLHSIIKAMPAEDTIYLGDTARVPYGTKSPGIVTQYSLEIGSFLTNLDLKALVVACNTASAVAIPSLKERFSIPVIDMIGPAARKAASVTKNGHIGVIGTEGTVKSGAYEKALRSLRNDMNIVNSACPLFVPLAEEGWTDNEIARMTAEIYLDRFKDETVDTLILGCTHYPLFKKTISNIMGNRVTLVDSGEEAAEELKSLFKANGEDETDSKAKRTYYVTDTPDRFLRLGEKFLGEEIGKVNHIDIP